MLVVVVVVLVDEVVGSAGNVVVVVVLGGGSVVLGGVMSHAATPCCLHARMSCFLHARRRWVVATQSSTAARQARRHRFAWPASATERTQDTTRRQRDSVRRIGSS